MSVKVIYSYIFLLVVFNSTVSIAQHAAQRITDTKNIAAMEEQRFHHLNTLKIITAASQNFNITYARFEWMADPSVRYISGKATFYFVITSSATDITLDLKNELQVNAVTQRNSPLSFTHINDALTITFSKSMDKGVSDSISIAYEGVPPQGGLGNFTVTAHNSAPVLWTLSEPYGSYYWWPCKNGLDDKIDSMDVYITHPSQYKAASNGLLQSETLINNGTQTITHWKHHYPIASYLVCMAVSNYDLISSSVQLNNIAMPVQVFCYPESYNAFLQNNPLLLDVISYYHRTYGDYPFLNEKYGEVQFGFAGGMEHQTSTFLNNPGENLVAHELAHQWFGDKITCGSWRDIWLNEGFASHLAAINDERNHPDKAIATRKAEIDEITSKPGGSVIVDDTSSVSGIFDSRLTYLKGSHVLYMLRWMLGEDVFLKALRSYQKDSTIIYGFAYTSQLQKHFEEAGGKDLSAFFDSWLYKQGYPSYNIEWSQVGSKNVRVKISQSTSHSSVSFFALPVALQFKNATQQKTIVFDNKSNGQLFDTTIGFIADTVVIDPDYWLITKNNTSKKVALTGYNENTVIVAPNPVRDILRVKLYNFNTGTVNVTLYSVTGQQLKTQQVNLIEGTELASINMTALPSAIYFLQISTDKGFKLLKKILKQ